MQLGTVSILGTSPFPCQYLALLMPECQSPLLDMRAYCPRTGQTMEIAKNTVGQHMVQAIKIGVAGIVSMLVAKVLKLPQGYWVAISAFVVMGSDVGATIVASRNRLIGTAIGAALAAVFVALLGSNLMWFGIAVATTTLICESAGLGQSYRLACVTVAIVMLINTADSPWRSAAYRFIEVALGIVIALLISALPPKSVVEP
jgi:uncharacterized membrane protein YccC